jgi:hypothetical protein
MEANSEPEHPTIQDSSASRPWPQVIMALLATLVSLTNFAAVSAPATGKRIT